MSSSTDENTNRAEPLFKRPAGVLLDEKQWLYLKERYHMTPRELQVAILVCRGFSNEEVTKALKIKYGTVKTHLRNIYRRVRVKSKITLLLRFIEDINKFYVPSKSDLGPIPISEISRMAGFPTKTPQKK
jgi:DNA-binding NarL/FixJ family response regulator